MITVTIAAPNAEGLAQALSVLAGTNVSVTATSDAKVAEVVSLRAVGGEA